MKIIYVLLLCSLWIGCSKEKFLDEKPNQAMVIPQTLEDLQAIVDNTGLLNGILGSNHPGIVPILGQTASDEYFFGRPNLYANAHPFIVNTYTWSQEDVYAGKNSVNDWTQLYKAILSLNICIEQLGKLSLSELEGRRIKGTALFHRAHLYYHLAQVFAPVYQKSTASSILGLPLRLKADVNEKLERNTLQETYNQIITDLEESIPYLPEQVSYTTRPTVTAAYAMLSRVYLSMSDYDKALEFSEEALERKSSLMDFNNLDSLSAYPISNNNEEIIFNCLSSIGGNIATAFVNSFASVDSMLVKAYSPGDLRKAIFTVKRTESQSLGYRFKGSYFGGIYFFSGLATDELYLIKAECLAREGRSDEACAVLNKLLEKRFRPEEFIPLDIDDNKELLHVIIMERRKELLYRGVRWTDLRRLNLDPLLAVTLRRSIGGEIFELPPNDPRYVYPIPHDVLMFYPDMEQNPR